MKTLLITGGSGFIGRALIRKLIGQYDITVLTRSVPLCRKYLGSSIKCIDSLDLIDDVGQFDVIINLAGEPIADKRWTQHQKTVICNSRWKLTQQLSDKIKVSKSPPSIFISSSAVGFYGRQPSDQKITELFSNYHQEFTHDLCSRWESLAQQATKKSRVVLLRTGLVLGNGQGILKKLEMPVKLGVGAILGDGTQMLPWVHIDDVVRSIIFLIKNDHCKGAFNITAPSPVSNKDFMQSLGRQFRRSVFLRIPSPVARLLFGEMSDLLIYGQNAIPQRLLDEGFEFIYSSLSDALRAIY